MTGTNETEASQAEEVGAQPAGLKEGPLPGADAAAFDDWLAHFYRECGRETTLAYTTLNQMKNWAVAIVAAFASAVAAFSRIAAQPGEGSILAVGFPIYVAAIFAYVFNVRFFIRAILCYINLVRWNTLQTAIASLKVSRSPRDASLTEDQLREKTLTKIRDYYFNWRSPIPRMNQLFSNLKLGFALLIALPLLFALVGGVSLWVNPLVRGLAVFAGGATLVELVDFMRSGYFDTVERAEARARRSTDRRTVFPIPATRFGYALLWLLTLVASAVVSLWPSIEPHWVALLERLR